MKCTYDPPSWIFVDMHIMSQVNRGHRIFLYRQALIILHSKLYSVCPWKYQDHLKHLKHLPIKYLVSKRILLYG
jgi:hypothetical protein